MIWCTLLWAKSTLDLMVENKTQKKKKMRERDEEIRRGRKKRKKSQLSMSMCMEICSHMFDLRPVAQRRELSLVYPAPFPFACLMSLMFAISLF